MRRLLVLRHCVFLPALLLLLAASAKLLAQFNDTPEINELQRKYDAELDTQRKSAIMREICQRDLQADQQKVPEFRNRWVNETDRKKKQQFGEDLATIGIHMAFNADQADDDDTRAQALAIVREVASGGLFEQKQIKTTVQSKRLKLKSLRSLEPDPNRDWVIRRATSKRVEVWLPRNGWLFDAEGKLIKEVHPPRRDGDGRDWLGAFLSDGRWVTTDLFAYDKVLTFFSPSGKWLKEIAGDMFVHQSNQASDYWSPPTVAWCRCVATGDAFVANVGQDGGRGVAWVNWSGDHHILENRYEPWKLCYPRDLEPKGNYLELYVPDDRYEIEIKRQAAGHGDLVGFPVYEAEHIYARIPDGDTFGFWPNSKDAYVVTKTSKWTRDEAGHSHEGAPTFQTWFYNADGTFAGWIDARRVADTPKLDGMLFVDSKQQVITLAKSYEVSAVEQFVWPDGSIAEPKRLSPDLALGFFLHNGDLELARW